MIREESAPFDTRSCTTAYSSLCELCVFARRRRHWLAEQRRRRDAAAVTLPVPLVPEDDARDAADAPLTSPRRRQSHEAHTA